MSTVEPVRLLDRRRYDPPRPVLVEHNGRWWNGWQWEWLLCDDGRGWRAGVQWTEDYEWGPGRHITTVPPTRLRTGKADGI